MLTNFRAFQLALGFHKECEKVPLSAPHLREQLNRAAPSVVLNLAEGSAKPSEKDRRRLYAVALGSLRECQAIAHLLNRKHLKSAADELAANLYRLVHPKNPEP